MSGSPLRPRRWRARAAWRALGAETAVRPAPLSWATFVVGGRDRLEPIAALPRVARRSVDRLLPELERALTLGVRAVMLFGVIDAAAKDAFGSAATDPEGPVPAALRAARAAFGDDLVLMTDVCLCGATDHGHCGILAPPRPGGRHARVLDGPTLPRLAEMAVRHAEAGADVVAPSDMMDGRVAALRAALDAGGHEGVAILSYAVKYASAFYGPFRDAAGSSPRGGVDGFAAPEDRRTYQMDPRNAREVALEVALDEAEGADLLLVKPALPYLDVVARVRARSDRPLVAYQVSGEYAMLEAAAAVGALDRAAAVREALIAVRRAGADLVLSYHALEAVAEGWLA